VIVDDATHEAIAVLKHCMGGEHLTRILSDCPIDRVSAISFECGHTGHHEQCQRH
jgi:hypothetical protein